MTEFKSDISTDEISVVQTKRFALKAINASFITFKSNPEGTPLLNDINIIAVKNKGKISWIHMDSRKETVLSMAIGKAIEANSMVEFGD